MSEKMKTCRVCKHFSELQPEDSERKHGYCNAPLPFAMCPGLRRHTWWRIVPSDADYLAKSCPCFSKKDDIADDFTDDFTGGFSDV